MNKIATFIICIIILVLGCDNPKKKLIANEKPEDLVSKIEEVKKSIPETNKAQENNEWNGNVYRNRFYQFRVEFPKGWEYDNGTSKITLARALERSKSVAISVTVKHLPTQVKNPNNIFESTANEDHEKLINKMLEIQNMKPVVNFKIEKGYLNNFPAYFISFSSETKSGTTIYKMYSKQIQCYCNSKIYQVNMNIPENMYDAQMETIYSRVYNSFNFEIAY